MLDKYEWMLQEKYEWMLQEIYEWMLREQPGKYILSEISKKENQTQLVYVMKIVTTQMTTICNMKYQFLGPEKNSLNIMLGFSIFRTQTMINLSTG